MPFAHRLLAILLAATAAAAPAKADPARAKALASEKAAAIAKIQSDHIAELRHMAGAPVVRDYFLAPLKERPARLAAVTKALEGRQMGSELCLIDSHGTEQLRAVRGRLAPDAELAKDEDTAPFFKGGMELPAEAVFVSPPYLSPDVEEWVIGYVVPVIPGQAILHFEHTIREMQAVASQGANGADRFVLLVDPLGFIVADSRRPVGLGLVGSAMEAKAYFRNIKSPESGLPPELAAAITGGAPKELKLRLDGKPWDVSWQEVTGLYVVAFDG